MLMVLSVAAIGSLALVVRVPPPPAGPAVGRRAACLGLAALPVLLRPRAALAEPPALTPSQMLTAGQYLNEVKDARRGLSELRPLLEGESYEAVRTSLRKPPLNGIRKACSKLLLLLADGSPLRKQKTATYEAIKVSLGVLDDGCRPDVAARPDLLAELAKLDAGLDRFSDGFGVSAFVE